MNALENDLITIIDFCNEMALLSRYTATPNTGAIMDAHDLAHVITGGDRTREWEYMGAVVWIWPDSVVGLSQAWPDVKRRMAVLLGRIGEPVLTSSEK